VLDRIKYLLTSAAAPAALEPTLALLGDLALGGVDVAHAICDTPGLVIHQYLHAPVEQIVKFWIYRPIVDVSRALDTCKDTKLMMKLVPVSNSSHGAVVLCQYNNAARVGDRNMRLVDVLTGGRPYGSIDLRNAISQAAAVALDHAQSLSPLVHSSDAFA